MSNADFSNVPIQWFKPLTDSETGAIVLVAQSAEGTLTNVPWDRWKPLVDSKHRLGVVIIGGSGGTADHSQLTNRDVANQHPISAITGLQDALDGTAGYLDFIPATGTEFRTNKVWTNGKPIYRQLVDCGLGNITNRATNVTANDLDTVTGAYPFASNAAANNVAAPLPLLNTAMSVGARVIITISPNTIIATFNATDTASWAPYRIFCIVEYTKATDPINSYSPVSNVVPTKDHQDLTSESRNQFGSHNATAIAYDETASVKEILDDKLDANSGIATNLIDGSDLTPMASQGWIRRNSSLYLPKPDCTVDAVNGNDAQAISEWQTSTWRTTPFKTIQKAIDFVLLSGWRGVAQVDIFLKSNADHQAGRVTTGGGVYFRLVSEDANTPATIVGCVRAQRGNGVAIDSLSIKSVSAYKYCAMAEGGHIVLLGKVRFAANGLNTPYGMIANSFGTVSTYAAEMSFDGFGTAALYANGGQMLFEGPAAKFEASNTGALFYLRNKGVIILGSDYSSQQVGVSGNVTYSGAGGEIVNSQFAPTKMA